METKELKTTWKIDTYAFCVRLPTKLAAKIKKTAKSKALTANQVIRRIVEQYYENN